MTQALGHRVPPVKQQNQISMIQRRLGTAHHCRMCSNRSPLLSPLQFMSNNNDMTKQEQSNELPAFQGKKIDEKRLEKLSKIRAKSAPKIDPKKEDRSKAEDELVKLNIVEEVYNELMKAYSFISVEEKLYVYVPEQGYWKLITDSESQRMLRQRVDRKWRGRVNKTNLQEIYEWLVLDAPHKSETIFREGRHYLNFSNLAYNWNKDKTTKDRKKLYFRYALNVPFKCNKGNGTFDKYLTDTFGTDTDTIRQFQKFCGLAISDMRTLKYAVIFYGRANSGKSVFMNLLRFIVGPLDTGAVSFSQMSSEFHVAQLLGKRLNLSAEVSGVTLSRLDVFRALCGNDQVLASHKMKDPFSFTNRCLLTFSCNLLPKISDPMEVQSVIERFLIFPFSNVKPREEWDPKLTEHLCDDYSAFIRFAIDGLKLLEEDHHTIQESSAMKRCKMQYAGQHDSFTLFEKEFLLPAKDHRVSSASIKTAYSKFCAINDCVELKDNIWGQILKRDFGCYACTISEKTDTKTHRIRAYEGIKFADSVVDLLQSSAPSPTIVNLLDND